MHVLVSVCLHRLLLGSCQHAPCATPPTRPPTPTPACALPPKNTGPGAGHHARLRRAGQRLPQGHQPQKGGHPRHRPQGRLRVRPVRLCQHGDARVEGACAWVCLWVCAHSRRIIITVWLVQAWGSCTCGPGAAANPLLLLLFHPALTSGRAALLHDARAGQHAGRQPQVDPAGRRPGRQLGARALWLGCLPVQGALSGPSAAAAAAPRGQQWATGAC